LNASIFSGPIRLREARLEDFPAYHRHRFSLLAFMTTFTQSPPMIGSAREPVYVKDCAKCHGKTAEGRHFGGPSLISDKPGRITRDLRNVIANGKGHAQI